MHAIRGSHCSSGEGGGSSVAPLVKGGVPKGRSPRISASACSVTEAMEETHGRVFQERGPRGHDERKEGSPLGQGTARPDGVARGFGIGSLSQMGRLQRHWGRVQP